MNLMNAKLFGQTFDILIGLNTSCTRLDDYDEHIHALRRSSSQMLKACFHVEDDNIPSVKDQAVDDSPQHHMLRADTAASGRLHGAKRQEFDSVVLFAVFIGDITYSRIYFVKPVVCTCLGALFDQFSHFGNRNDRIEDFFRKSKRKAQIGIRIDICSQNRMAFFCIKSCKGRCDGCFSYATLSSYCYFHFTPFHFKKGGLFLRQGPPCPFYTPSAARFSSIRASIASPSLSMSFSTV